MVRTERDLYTEYWQRYVGNIPRKFYLSNNRVNYFEEADTKYEYNSATGRPYGYQRTDRIRLFKDDEDIANSPKQTFGSYLPEILNTRMSMETVL